MSHSWLQRQRKQTLLDLSQEAGLKQEEDLRKDELVDALDEYLQKNSTRLSGTKSFDGYYGTKRSTPFKPRESATSATAVVSSAVEDAVSEVKSVVKARGRKSTKVKQESGEEGILPSPTQVKEMASNALSSVTSALSPSSVLSPSTQLTSRTPAPRVRRRSELPGPPSPADVADIVEYESHAFIARVKKVYKASGVDEHIANARETFSSVTSIQLTFLFIEAFALQRRILPWKYAFDTPAVPAANIPSTAVKLPDLFILLTGYYWSATLLFAATHILVPLLFAYFYNLTMRDVKRGTQRVTVARYAADPLTYNVVKGLITWLVYSQGATFGFINGETAQRVDSAIWGGNRAVLIGSGIGALAALYEAAQRRVVQ